MIFASVCLLFDVGRQRSIAVINASGVCSWNGPYTFNDFSGRAMARKPIEQLLLDNTWLECIAVTNMVEYPATFLTLGNVFFSVVRRRESEPELTFKTLVLKRSSINGQSRAMNSLQPARYCRDVNSEWSLVLSGPWCRILP